MPSLLVGVAVEAVAGSHSSRRVEAPRGGHMDYSVAVAVAGQDADGGVADGRKGVVAGGDRRVGEKATEHAPLPSPGRWGFPENAMPPRGC